jgi:hypothetical protein
MVMVKLIIQKKITRYSNNKKFSLLGKSSGVILLMSNPDVGAWYSGLCGQECCLSCQKAWGGDSWRIFFSLFLPWSYGPSITSRSSDVVSPNDWFVSSIWFLLSTGKVAIVA